MHRRMLGLLAGPILLAQCGPTQCSPAPVATPPTASVAPAPPSPPPVDPATTASTTTTTAAPTATTAPAVSTSWAFLRTNTAGQYTRWSACGGPIRYQLDVVTAPVSADVRASIGAALASASAASGHTFEYVGDSGPVLLPTVDVVIGQRDFPAGTLGQGGGRFTSALEMVSGTAYVEVGLSPEMLRTTLLHELAHMLGLGHVPDNEQVMYHAVRTPPRQQYNWGDLEGLRLVGATMPCLAGLQRDGEPTTEILLD